MKTVLIVEDTQSERQLLSALLSQAGLAVAAAENVENAWKWLETHSQPDLILLDIIMPDDSGLELCRRVRERAEWEQVPIIFCSSKSEEFDRFWALRQGGNDYVTKPYAPQDLLETVEKHLN